MNQKRVVTGLLLVVTGIILNRLELGSDLADFIMGISLGLGLGILVSGLVKPKRKHI